ncbi:hypothetical protein ACLOJK_002284 [Asimina triloba]
MEIEKFEVKPSFAARFGKILFDGSIDLNTIWKKLIAETTSRNQVKKLFYTNVPSVYMETVQSLVVPKVGLDFESEKENYHVKEGALKTEMGTLPMGVAWMTKVEDGAPEMG